MCPSFCPSIYLYGSPSLAFLHIYLYISISNSSCASLLTVSVYLYLSPSIYLCTQIYFSIYRSIYTYLSTCLPTCAYERERERKKNKNMYTYTYTYTYTQPPKWHFWRFKSKSALVRGSGLELSHQTGARLNLSGLFELETLRSRSGAVPASSNTSIGVTVF